MNWADNWAFQEEMDSDDQVLRALARAWYHAQYVPQNCGQYRAAVLLPAIEARKEELAGKPCIRILTSMDEERMEIQCGGSTLVSGNYDEHGSAGLRILRKTAVAVANAAGLEVKDEPLEGDFN